MGKIFFDEHRGTGNLKTCLLKQQDFYKKASKESDPTVDASYVVSEMIAKAGTGADLPIRQSRQPPGAPSCQGAPRKQWESMEVSQLFFYGFDYRLQV